jgi:DNA-binding NtrC family response regulator
MNVAEQKRILILDDDDFLMEILSEALAYHPDYRVNAKHCSGDIYECIREYHPHVVIIDYLKSNLNDEELFKTIEKTSVNTSTAFIILTGCPNTMATLGNFNQADYLPKPFNLDELELKIANLISY